MDSRIDNLIASISATLTGIEHLLPSFRPSSPFYKDPQWWAIAVALLLGIVGIFQDWIRAIFKKPKLHVDIKLEPPDCHKIALRNSQTGQFICDTYYFRFRVTNAGNYPMEDVEVLTAELHNKINGQYKKVNNFLPINLHWAHNHVVTMPKIQPKLFKHCDFGHIIETNTNFGGKILTYYGFNTKANIIMQLDTFIEPNTGSHILFPGEYKIKIIFSANNVSPYEIWFKLTLKDKWDSNETAMLQNNISIKKIS